MVKQPKNYSADFKLKIAIEAESLIKPISKIASENKLHPRQVRRWRDQLLSEGKEVFTHKAAKRGKSQSTEYREFSETIDQLRAELNFLKKKLRNYL